MGAICLTKLQTSLTGKSGPPEGWISFFKTFQLDPTDPLIFVTKLPEVLVEWIVRSNSSHFHPTLRVISQLIHKEKTTTKKGISKIINNWDL